MEDLKVIIEQSVDVVVDVKVEVEEVALDFLIDEIVQECGVCFDRVEVEVVLLKIVSIDARRLKYLDFFQLLEVVGVEAHLLFLEQYKLESHL